MRRMPRPTTLIGSLLVAAALTLTGCATNPGGASSPSAAGTWGDADTRTEPSLVLAEGGALTGTDGCNRLHGSWTQDGDTLAFDRVASTRMACPDVDAWLSGLARAVIDGDTMTVLQESGDVIGTLTRSE